MGHHCCEKMEYYLTLIMSGDTNIAIRYNDVFREYGILVLDDNSQIVIDYCPWCGKKLPKKLVDEWFNILEEMFDNFNGFADDRIPEEFKTDAWWREREL